jgi:outer membrane murein-binding lipoprotein Lpp
LSFIEREVFVKTALVSTIAALVALVAMAAPASAATPSQQRLARDVRTLKAQVKTLQRQVKTLRTQVRTAQNIASGAVLISACSTAATADAFQGTWEAIDRHAAVNGHGPDQFPAQAAIADPLNSCQALEVQRQPNIVPPTTNVFAALLNIFR